MPSQLRICTGVAHFGSQVQQHLWQWRRTLENASVGVLLLIGTGNRIGVDYTMNFIELLHKGGPIVWVLAAYSSIGLAIVLESLLPAHPAAPPATIARQLNQLLDQPEAFTSVTSLRGPEANVVRAIMEADRLGSGFAECRRPGLLQERQCLDFGLSTLGILGSTAPLLGLLGTITGMIKAFMLSRRPAARSTLRRWLAESGEMVTTGVGACGGHSWSSAPFLEGSVEQRAQSIQRSAALLLETIEQRPEGSAGTGTSALGESYRWTLNDAGVPEPYST